MCKKDMLEAYKKIEEEWAYMGIKEKTKKIKHHLTELEADTSEQKSYIDDLVLMLEELDIKEKSILIENLHTVIMENSMKVINDMKE